MSEAPWLSVVLPCRNQADHIGKVLETYFQPLDCLDRPYELIVVPNASTDDTLAVVQRLAERDRRVRVVENPAGGWGLSVRAGLDIAWGKVLCYTNSARTDPTQIPVLLELYEKNAPCLAKVRREKRQAPLRQLGSLLYNLQSRLLFGVRTPDVNGTPKIFSRELYQSLRLESAGDLLDLELMAHVARLGVPVVELPIAGFRRHGGKSSTGFATAWGLYTGALRLRATLKS